VKEYSLKEKGEIEMAVPSKLAHVVYMTRRFDEMLDWYQLVFETTVQYKNPAFAFLTFDDEHHRFAFANMEALTPAIPGADAPPGVGVNHIGYTYANLGDLLETYDRLKQAGVFPYWHVHHGVTLSIYYRDPDGNRMEFQVDCCADAAEAHEFMQGDGFATNPVGVAIDADVLLEKYRQGVPISTLMLQPVGPVADIPAEHGLTV
jgi:catechol 2,3-dioxygenase-like lactoylglutathione lyase family enzyme